MASLVVLLMALAGDLAPTEYARLLSEKKLDQATLDAEGYGEKKSFKREADGLRVKLGPGEPETGWKTPQQLRFGGDFTVSATFVIKKLPKPAQEDGAAIGLAIAFGDINQPDLALVRLIEPANSADVYRSIEKASDNPGQMQPQMGMPGMMVMPMGQPGGKPVKPPRRTFPAAGETVRMEIQREGNTIRVQIVDAKSPRPRYLGQFTLAGGDVAAVKLFASNRNGAEAVDVLMRDLTIRAARINGLGTIVRSVFDEVIYGDPSSIENGVLIVGGQPKTPPGATPKPNEAKAPNPAAAPGAAAPGAAAAPAAVPGGAVVVAAAPAGAMPVGAVVFAPAPGMAPTPPPGSAPVPPGTTAPAPGGAPPQQPAQPPKPKAKLPFDEVESIHFERSLALSARYVGQPNFDFTLPGISAKKDEAKAAADAAKPSAATAKAGTEKGAIKKDGAKPADASKPRAATPKAGTEKGAMKKESASPAAATTKKAEGKKATDTPKEEKKDMPKADAKNDQGKKADAEKADGKKADAKKADAKKADAKKADAKKDQDKKTGPDEDPLAPPPGTTITKIAKVEPKKNGIRDLQITLFGLRPAKIKQITVTCQTDGGPSNWRLDTSDSEDSPIFIRRSGTGTSADLFLEPPSKDCHQKDFTIAVNYEDGQAANTQVKAGDHTAPKLAVDPKAPSVPPLDAWVYLSGDEKLFGKLESIGQETLRLTTPWQDHLDIPLGRVAGLQLGLLEPKEPVESFTKRLKSRGSEDLLLAQTKKGEVIVIAGVVEHAENGRLHFQYQGRSRTLPLEQVEGLILAARPDSPAPDELRPTFTLTAGVVLSGKWKSLNTEVWKLQTAWGQDVNLPASGIQEVRFRGGKVTYLSDLSPSKVEEAPFFGHRLPWRRDVNLQGEPLKINGRTYERGLAVHSRCVLTYDLNGRFSKFESLVGFDDAARTLGRVDCRVFADGKELYANRDLRADGPPAKLVLPVAGAEQLRLHVDFGADQDTGDRVIWADARLHRAPSPGPAVTAAPPRGH
jgi:hypothetical protein